MMMVNNIELCRVLYNEGSVFFSITHLFLHYRINLRLDFVMIAHQTSAFCCRGPGSADTLSPCQYAQDNHKQQTHNSSGDSDHHVSNLCGRSCIKTPATSDKHFSLPITPSRQSSVVWGDGFAVVVVVGDDTLGLAVVAAAAAAAAAGSIGRTVKVAMLLTGSMNEH